jgi:hypothetical protein
MEKTNLSYVGILKASDTAGSIAGSGSVSQRYGTTDTDPYQNVMDPQQ